MKNTTFRKKALLSSVAMLLVAFIALGSATFAWFTTNPEVTASGLTMNATTDAGLQILSATAEEAGADWGTSTILNAKAGANEGEVVPNTDAKTFVTPISHDLSVAGVVWRTTQAAVEYEYARTDAPISSGDGVAPSYSEIIKLRSSLDNGKTISVQQATVTINPATGQGEATKLFPAVRVSLVDVNTGALIGTWAPDGRVNKYLTATGVSSEDTVTVASGTATAMSKDVTFDGTTVMMHVWLDGEDAACYTENVEPLQKLVSSISVKFSTTALS